MGKRAREKFARRFGLAENGLEKPKFQYQSGLEKACIFIIRWGTYIALFAPLLINTKFFFPFVAPKTVFFRIIVDILLAAYLFLLASNAGKYRPRMNALTLAVTLFLVVYILASFIGINFERSFWSTYERMTGIWTMLHLYAFFIILSSVFKKREDWEKFLGVSIITGVLLSFYVLRGSEISTRGGGTIGNTSFMAAYLLFDIFFAIILFLSNFLKKGGRSLFWQIFSGISLLIMLPVLFNSTARGAIVSFLAGLFLLCLGYLIFSQKKFLRRLALGIILILVILSITLLALQPPFAKNKIETTLGDMQSRFVVWDKALKGFLERPILGWGPENFNVVFLKYFNPCMSLPRCGSEVWFDRAHNIVLDTMVTTGAIGLLSYLAVFGVAIYGLLKIASKAALGLSALLIIYFFQNLLVFDMINTYLMFFLSLAFTGFLIQQKPEESEAKTARRTNPILGLLIAVFMAAVIFWGNIQPIVANYNIIKSLRTQYVDQAILFFQKSLSTSMNKYETREYFTQRMVKAAGQDVSEDMRPVFQKALDFTESEMEKSIQENPLDFRHHLFLGELYVNSFRFSRNPEKLERAQAVMERAIELSPTNQQGYWQLAEIEVTKGKIEEAIPLLRKAIELEPEVGRAHWYLAMAYQISGNNQLAKKTILEAEKNGFNWKDNLDNLRRVIDIYRAVGDDVGLVPIYQKALELAPDDAKIWAELAASYANLGQYQKARESAEKAAEINPEMIPEVEKFLKLL